MSDIKHISQIKFDQLPSSVFIIQDSQIRGVSGTFLQKQNPSISGTLNVKGSGDFDGSVNAMNYKLKDNNINLYYQNTAVSSKYSPIFVTQLTSSYLTLGTTYTDTNNNYISTSWLSDLTYDLSGLIPVEDRFYINVGMNYPCSGWNSVVIGTKNANFDHLNLLNGYGVSCYGRASHAQGGGTITNIGSQDSHAEGMNTETFGKGSHSEGSYSKAIGRITHAQGDSTSAYLQGSHAEGLVTIVSGNYSHVEGQKNEVYGEGSHGEGLNTIILGNYSHVEGNLVSALSNFSHSEGSKTAVNGNYSHAQGISTKTNNQYSHAQGISTNANGQGSHSEGQATTAGGKCSHSEGNKANANGNYSHAQGDNSTANGMAAHAEGNNTKAIGNYSHTEGHSNIAAGQVSHVQGRSNSISGYAAHGQGSDNTITINGNYSHVEGQSNIVDNIYSHAEGQNTTASGKYSHAEGLGTIANKSYQHVQGKYNDWESLTDKDIFIIGCGTSDVNRKNALVVKTDGNATFSGAVTATNFLLNGIQPNNANGLVKLVGNKIPSALIDINSFDVSDYVKYSGNSKRINGSLQHGGNAVEATGQESHAEGYWSKAYGKWSHAEGQGGKAYGIGSHGEGNNSIASGDYSHAEGYQTVVIGNNSHAEGYITSAMLQYSHAQGGAATASGVFSHAEGERAIAIGQSSHSEGLSSITYGSKSHAEGYKTITYGQYSHAEGQETITNGQSAHSEGVKTTSIGYASHAQGGGCIASGQWSHAQGYYTVANYDYQHVQGKFNDYTSTNAIFVVGGGTSDTSRRNALTVDVNGNAQFRGNIEANSIILNNNAPNSAGGLVQLNSNGKIPDNLYTTAGSQYVINVKDYGAVGDGKTDDTNSFKTAIANAAGKILFIPSGNYKVDTLNITNPMHIVGVQKQVTYLYPKTTSTIIFNIQLQGEYPILIENIGFIGNDDVINGNSSFIKIKNTSTNYDSIIRNCLFFKGCYGIYNINTGTMKIEDCRFQSNKYSIFFTADTAANEDTGDSTIHGCFFANTDNTVESVGIWQQACGGLRIINNKFIGQTYSYLGKFYTPKRKAEDPTTDGTSILIVEGNSFQSFGVGAIVIQPYDPSKNTRTTFTSVIINGNQFSLTNQTTSTANKYGIIVRTLGNSETTKLIRGAIISNNEFTMYLNPLNYNYGISLNAVENSVIERNVFVPLYGNFKYNNQGVKLIVTQSQCQNISIYHQGFDNSGNDSKDYMVLNGSGIHKYNF